MLEAAASVQVVDGSEFDPRRRKNNQVLATSSDASDVSALVAALRVRELHEQAALMTPGHPTLAFFDGNGRYLTHVISLGEHLRWHEFPFDAPLADPLALRTWLAAHGLGG